MSVFVRICKLVNITLLCFPGAGSIGYPGVIHGMFPQGGADLVSYFYASCNKTLAKQLKEAVEANEQPK